MFAYQEVNFEHLGTGMAIQKAILDGTSAARLMYYSCVIETKEFRRW